MHHTGAMRSHREDRDAAQHTQPQRRQRLPGSMTDGVAAAMLPLAPPPSSFPRPQEAPGGAPADAGGAAGHAENGAPVQPPKPVRTLSGLIPSECFLYPRQQLCSQSNRSAQSLVVQYVGTERATNGLQAFRIEQRPDRTAKLSDKDKKRGRRMLGALQGHLLASECAPDSRCSHDSSYDLCKLCILLC